MLYITALPTEITPVFTEFSSQPGEFEKTSEIIEHKSLSTSALPLVRTVTTTSAGQSGLLTTILP